MFDSDNIYGTVAGIFSGFLNSGFFNGVKFLLSVYTLVLLADIVMLLILRGVGGSIRTTFQGVDVPSLSKKKWKKVINRINQANPSQYKVAILEADKIVDDVLGGMGFKGENMTEKLNHPSAIHISDREDLKKAHQVRNRIIHENDFQLDRAEAVKVIKVFEDFLHEAELLD
jgi:hypothetical protein